VPLHEPKERAVAGSVTEHGRHLVTFRQVIPERPKTLK